MIAVLLLFVFNLLTLFAMALQPGGVIYLLINKQFGMKHVSFYSLFIFGITVFVLLLQEARQYKFIYIFCLFQLLMLLAVFTGFFGRG
jgi:hypothetical protein